MIRCKDNTHDIIPFDIKDFQNEIDEFPSSDNIGPVNSVDDLLDKAERIPIRVYGEEIKNEKPFEVSHDGKHEIWMICGTLTPGYEGGAVNILV